jgi:hypothetical protein
MSVTNEPKVLANSEIEDYVNWRIVPLDALDIVEYYRTNYGHDTCVIAAFKLWVRGIYLNLGPRTIK